jgi:hypothetical protein
VIWQKTEAKAETEKQSPVWRREVEKGEGWERVWERQVIGEAEREVE